MDSADGQNRRKRDKAADPASKSAQPSPQPETATPYAPLFHAITEAVAIWRPLYDKRGAVRDLVFETANEAFKQLFGVFDPEGRKARKLSPSLDQGLPQVLEMCALVAGSSARMQRECYFSLLDKWLSVKVWCPTKDHALAAFEDITERKLVAERLRRLEFSLDNMDDYPTWNDAEGRIIEVSESTCRHLEYTRDELLNMTVFDICPDMDIEAWRKSWEEVKPPRSLRVETRHRTKSGRFFAVEVTVSPMVFNGREYHCTYCRDISDRKEVQGALERTRFALDHLRDYPVWVDEEGRIVEVSETTCRTLEYTREELLGMTVFDIDPEATPEFWTEHWERLKKVGSGVAERRHRAKSGRLIPVDVAANYIVFGDQAYDCGFCRDISDRRKLEESLRFTQFSVDRAPDAIHWLDADGHITYANQAACKLFGYSKEELRHKHIWDISLRTSQKLFMERWGAVAESGSALFEDVYRAKDGQTHDVEISAAHVLNGDEEVGLAFVRDISEWKRAQRSLRDSEERYRQLFELESDAIMLTEKESGSIIEVNEAACSLYGYTREELASMKSQELFCEVEQPGPALSGCVTELAFHWHKKKDGTVFPVETHGRHFEWRGQQVQVTAVRDVSERKHAADELEESRRMLRQVLDAVPLRIAWRDRELRYLGCNLTAALAWRLADPSAIVGLRDEELPLYNVNEQCRVDDREVMATGIPKLQYEETAVTPDGDTRIMRTSKVPLSDRSGDVFGVLSVHENITEQAAIRRALKEREEQLRQSQKMEAVGRLAGGIAHDFNNVLTTIIGYSDLILSSPDGPQKSIAEDIGEIKAAAERAGSLTRRILAFSRRQALQPAVLSLNSIVSETERLLARTLGADVELRVSLSPDLGQVEIDEHQFVQVLLNLAVNARDAMPDGGVLTLETANVDLNQRFCETHPDTHPGPYVVLSVSDTGTGMDADTMAHAFEPFYTTKPPGLGTGLGLSTVYGVVAQSGGSTYVHSEPGHGSTFSIYLPRVQTETPSRESEVGAAEGTAKGKIIMVVDDDATFLGLTVRILERRGYQVLLAHNGEQAIAMLGDPTISVDALITDVSLPGSEQGDKVAAFASASRPGLPVLFMSVQPHGRMVHEGKVSERAAYLEKPFTAEELTSRVRTSLGET